MSMPAVQKRWTIEEVDRLIEERPGYTPRYELVDGELLVTPSPTGRHQRLIGMLHLLLHPYVTAHRQYWVVDGDAEAFEVWRPGDARASLLDDRLVWSPDGATEPLSVDIAEFFARAADDDLTVGTMIA